ncbi:MAG TPA: efflux RND transporter periplasmic adaptor subunit [Gemmatimonadaceae bacterium]|jgi:membrane fusion protein (multidrug efflux system)|nr:efflux RND transporter periplasmic adaptor subunit [Gemmatimonadaceae bacterium]
MRCIPPVLAAALVVSACGKKTPPAPPPPAVSVITVTPRPVAEQVELVGQVQAFRTVQVRAQVSGVIVARPFREGSEVRAGDVLYRIDQTTYDADWRSARARAAEAEAQLANAETNAKRLGPLLADNAVAKQEVDNAETAVKQAQAAVDDAHAAVDHAKKLLDETIVRAEIAGRVGRAVLDVGTRVTGPSDVLTTIDVLDPIYVSFRPSAEQQLSWRRDPESQRALQPGGSVKVQATFADGTTFPTMGRIGFVDPVVDPATGTQEYRAEFANPHHVLLPGQFVRVRLLGLTHDSAIVVPQRAVLQQLGVQSVYVVGKGDTVAARPVKAAGWTGNDWLIQSGLRAGERVVVDGVQKIGPGMVVRPTALVDTTMRERVAGDSATPIGGAR